MQTHQILLLAGYIADLDITRPIEAKVVELALPLLLLPPSTVAAVGSPLPEKP